MASNEFRVGLLSAGHANAGMAAYLSYRGIQPVVFALPEHLGFIRAVKANDNTLSSVGTCEGHFRIEIAGDLSDVIKSTQLLILGTRTDAHEAYVQALEQHNDILAGKYLFVMSGNGFTMVYGNRLRCTIVESNTAPLAAKFTGHQADIKDMKTEFEVSSFPVHANEGGPCFPAELGVVLGRVFRATLEIRTPLHIALSCTNAIVHHPPAVLNMGRLNDAASLTTKAQELLRSLYERNALELLKDDRPVNTKGTQLLHAIARGGAINPDHPDLALSDAGRALFVQVADRLPHLTGFFYGQWMNSPVLAVMSKLDQARLELGQHLGMKLYSILDDCNKDYGTAYPNMRDYSLAPTPHNVQQVAPKDLESRLYREEFIILTLWAAIADIAKTSMPAFGAFLWMTSSAYEEPLPTFGRELSGFTRDDLIAFGAKFA